MRDVLAAAAACRGRVATTPLEPAAELGGDGREVRLKLEAFQRTGSFKIRGALAGLAQHVGRTRTVVTASAGNHALGLAEAAVELGVPVRIFVPSSADAGKLARLRAYGEPVELVAVDGSYDDTERAARAACEADPGAAFLSSYNDRGVVAGQATVALELLEQWPEVEAVVVPVGGGGLIGGIGLAVRHLAPAVVVVGVEPAQSCALSASLDAGRVTTIDDRGSIAEGLVGNLDADSITFPLAQQVVDEIVLAGEDEIRAAVRRLYDATGVVAEPSGAVALVALDRARALRDVERVACVITGRNVTPRAHRQLIA
jgi:threonine dehydratase